MPRQSRGPAPAPAPRRPTAPAPAPRQPAQQQTRQASTAAAPQQRAAPPAQQQAPPTAGSQGPGLFGQMASTAAGVAVGSSIGHAIGGFFGGGSSAPAAPVESQAPQTEQAYSTMTNQSAPAVCANQVTDFRKCMDENSGSLTICGWYLDQLKACQSAASQY